MLGVDEVMGRPVLDGGYARARELPAPKRRRRRAMNTAAEKTADNDCARRGAGAVHVTLSCH